MNTRIQWFTLGLILGLITGILLSPITPIKIGNAYGYEGRDWNGDGDIDCIFGAFDNGECRPCYGFDLMFGRVICSDEEPYAGAKVKFTNLITKQVDWVETGRRGWYYKLAPFLSYYKVEFAGQSRLVFNFGFCIPRYIKPFEDIICQTPITTTILPSTTSVFTTTINQVTTTVSPSTTTVLTSSTSMEPSSTSSITPETTTTSTVSTTTTSIRLKCEMACKLLCNKIPFDAQGWWEQTEEVQDCFQECMKDCTPVKGWERTDK